MSTSVQCEKKSGRSHLVRVGIWLRSIWLTDVNFYVTVRQIERARCVLYGQSATCLFCSVTHPMKALEVLLSSPAGQKI